MEKPADHVTGITDLRSSSRVRRRLVQSTLFPHTPYDKAVAGEDCEIDEDREDEEDEEYCGSNQTKKKQQRKPKATKPKSRASKKVVLTNKETPNKGTNEEESPVTNKSNFFVKVSEKRQQKRQQKEQSYLISPKNDDNSGSSKDGDILSSPPKLETDDMKSSQKQKRRCRARLEKSNTSPTPKERCASAMPEKRRKNSTPKKKLVDSGSNGLFGQMKNPTQAEHASQLIPNLRLEAKLKSEEISRIYGGKQLHPFFSARKMVKRNQEGIDQSNSSWVDKKDKYVSFRPIHVFEQAKDEHLSPDWGKWVFNERSDSANSVLESKPSTVCERTVKSLHFDNFLNISGGHNNGSSNLCPIQVDGALLHQSLVQQDCFVSVSSTGLTDEQVAYCERSRREVDHNMGKVDSCKTDSKCDQNSDVRMSYGHDLVNQPQNSLWTNKYQPKLASEICGNSEGVNFLNDWLRLWYENGSGTRTTISDIYSARNTDNFYTSDSDSEYIDEENRLKNVLLITGPVGSGKSAAIYACAKEQGFQVIEVNTSDWRNGALVKQKFGEAVESHWLQCSTDNPERSDIKHFFKSFPISCDAPADHGTGNDVITLIPSSDDENSDNIKMPSKKSVSDKSKNVIEQSNIKTLILFEDVDATLCEDRGFTSTIQQLAETAKRPMILTSNSNNPVLPSNLDRLELCFSKPSVKELLGLVSMVCSAEKVNVPPCLVKRFIKLCQRDIRKTILQLQFWCQGQNYGRDRKMLGTYGLMVFDLDAGHNILPKMISSGYASQLSEIVDREITKSLLELEEASCLNEIDEESLKINDTRMPKFQPNSIDARKDAMLSWHCSDQDGNELPSQLGTSDLSESAGSPIAFGRRTVRRRNDTVLSSESGEECSSDGFPVVPSNFSEKNDFGEHLEVISKAPSHCFAPEMSFNPFNEQLLHSDDEKLGDSSHCANTEDFVLLNGTCRSVDVSRVPESTCVAETENFSDTVSWENVDNMAETALTKNDLPLSIKLNVSPSGLHEIPIFIRNVNDAITDPVREADEMAEFHVNGEDSVCKTCDFPQTGIDVNVSPPELYETPILHENSCDTITESVQEEVADSHVECDRAVSRACQGMDECSRMNFNMRSKFKKNQSAFFPSDTVQETWKKLRNCHMDLHQYASLEHKDAPKVLKVAHQLSDLISEADLLLSDCQLQICDYVEPSIFPCETSHSPKWYDDQLKMVSTISEHGMCSYAKHMDETSTDMVSLNVDLAWEMLAASTNMMALGKLVNQDKKRIKSSEINLPKSVFLSQRDLSSSLCSVVQSIIPTRSYLSVIGDALHEYLSSLSQISRSEANRLSESLDKSRKRRLRVAKNYLSATTPSLTPEDMSLLNRYNCYQNLPLSDDEI